MVLNPLSLDLKRNIASRTIGWSFDNLRYSCLVYARLNGKHVLAWVKEQVGNGNISDGLTVCKAL